MNGFLWLSMAGVPGNAGMKEQVVLLRCVQSASNWFVLSRCSKFWEKHQFHFIGRHGTQIVVCVQSGQNTYLYVAVNIVLADRVFIGMLSNRLFNAIYASIIIKSPATTGYV